ncbi:MAG: exopolyphosphatase [Rhodospirillales bacterium]|nr:exopolyphosphatase [Rhodospirillales bacterium]
MLTRGLRSKNRTENLIAALDLGSNNCRLLIARPKKNGFKIVDGFSKIVRLGESVSSSRELSSSAMERTMKALSVCAELIVKYDVKYGRYVATEACRASINGEKFLSRVEKEIGITLEIIPSHEEAELTLIGCRTLLDNSCAYALVFDVGGGSTEISWVRLGSNVNPEIIDTISLPYGVVNLTETYGTPEISSKQYEILVGLIKNSIEPFEKKHSIKTKIKAGKVSMLGTAGTVTTIAAVQMGLKFYDRALIDGSWLDLSSIRNICENLVNSNFVKRASYPCIGKNRAELVVAGCGILKAICETWQASRLRVADRGVREGILTKLSELAIALEDTSVNKSYQCSVAQLLVPKTKRQNRKHGSK